ncbi:CaiB/BaiF CoA transferase family protein [Umboniibacter marinipuniceus]|uniref:Crotonobetainyl-CoA:carnitine CoA-transferase CaiB-like acyl-CoA transferase n=1 Tax=Umboniibacter marinipuniceus TaxID=569599 RepID=A0A3M0A758_9GAMM|nr:CaiB/BaiF CoA-transferase family protein [Umboniibacter marinipuniceus]RMA80981.1 crotonobetainyl-CoA:carnitine CoA-transferase CaiB-like acyl-CoA transferase [Umboniibacter marinipuniceus]
MTQTNSTGGPLAGLKVIDFTTLLPGPYATHLLADMGAEVIRVESISRPDLLKMVQPLVDGQSAAHLSINRNKQSVALDLKHEVGQRIAQALIATADIVIEGFRPGVMARLNLDYGALSSSQPELIYCSITGYGQTGGLAQRAGHDINYLARSGLASYSGKAEHGPSLSGFQIADIAGGSQQAVMAVCAAVIERFRTGQGQYLDISMLDAALALNTMTGASYLAGGACPQLGSELLAGGSLYDYYQTADERYLSIGSLEPQFLAQLLTALGLSSYLANPTELGKKLVELKADITRVIRSESLTHWSACFAELDCCVEPVMSLEEVMAEDWVAERGMRVEAKLPSGETITQLRSSLPFAVDKYESGSELGAHTEQLLKALGYVPSEVEKLRELGVIA